MTIDELCRELRARLSEMSESDCNEVMSGIIGILEPAPEGKVHWSSCAHYNAPAYPPNWCDCNPLAEAN